MNLKNTWRSLPAFLLTASLIFFIGAATNAISNSPASHYKECTSLAANDPAKALDFTKEWLEKNPTSPAARHCEALSYYSMKHYPEAARLLEALAGEARGEKPQLAANLSLQAANAWRAANNPREALRTLTSAMGEANLPANARIMLLLARADLYREMKQNLKAVQDLDNVLALDPANARAKVLLAEITGKNLPAPHAAP